MEEGEIILWTMVFRLWIEVIGIQRWWWHKVEFRFKKYQSDEKSLIIEMNLSEMKLGYNTFGNYTAIVQPPEEIVKISHQQNCLVCFIQLIRTGISLPISSHNRPYYSTSKTITEHTSTVSSFLILDFKHNLVEANWKTRQMFKFCTIYETWTSSAFERKSQEAKTTDVP